MSELYTGTVSNIQERNRALSADEILNLYKHNINPKAEYTESMEPRPVWTQLLSNEYGQHYVIEGRQFTHFMTIKKKKWKAPAIYLNGKRILGHTKKYSIRYLVERDRWRRSSMPTII